MRKHGLEAVVREQIPFAKSVVDVGSGVRPCSPYSDASYVRVEPCKTYFDILERGGEKAINKTALEALPIKTDVVLLLDVIEHMEKEEGLVVLEKAKKSAEVGVVVITPNGFQEQNVDKWGYGEDSWQTHRSGWVEKDFIGWDVSTISRGRLILAVYK